MGIEQEVEAAGGKVCAECQVIYVQKDGCPKCRIEAPARAAEAAAARAIRIEAMARELFLRNLFLLLPSEEGAESEPNRLAKEAIKAATAYVDASDEMVAELIPKGDGG